MGILLVFAQQLAYSCQSVSTRACSRRNGNGGLVYNAIIAFFAFCFSLVTGLIEGLSFPLGIWIYGIASGLLYFGGFYYAFKSFQSGPFTLIKLITAFGMMTGIIYGIVVRGEKMSVIIAVAIVLIFVAIFFANADKDGDVGQGGSKIWLLYTILYMLCNAGIAILQLMQQDRFYIVNEKGSKIPTCNTEFLIIAYATACISLLVVSLAKDANRMGGILRKCLPFGVAAGSFNAISNLLSLEANRHIEQTIKLPFGTGCSLAIGFVIGFLIYKERLSKRQMFGLVTGVVAVALLLVRNFTS